MRPYDEESISNRVPRRRFVLSAAILNSVAGKRLTWDILTSQEAG
jgi:hypothetical protein